MPTEVRRVTLKRRTHNTLDRLSLVQKQNLINSLLSEDKNDGNEGIEGNDQVITIEADPEKSPGSEPSMCSPVSLSNEDGLKNNSLQVGSVKSPRKELSTSSTSATGEHEIDNSNNCKDTHTHLQDNLITPEQNKNEAGAAPVSEKRKVFSIRSISNVSENFVENINSFVETPPIRRLNDMRKLIGKVVNDNKVQGVILSLIMINAILMGVATFPVVKDNPIISSRFQVIDQIFLVIFTIEASMQLIYHGWTLFKDAFLVFDLTIVALSWAAEGVKVIRAFRVFRSLRLVARIEVMRNLILALVSVIPNMTGISLLLFLVFYISAVMFTQLYKDTSMQYPREEQYFVGLPETFFTLFQMMTLDGWSKIYRQAFDVNVWSWMPFVAFIVVTAFVFANLIIAVICDAVHVLDGEDVAELTNLTVDEIVTKEPRLRNSSSQDHLGDNGKNKVLGEPNSSTKQQLRDMETQLNNIVEVQNAVKATLNLLVKESDVGMHNSDSILFQNEDTAERSQLISPFKSLGRDQFAVSTDILPEQQSELLPEDEQLTDYTMKDIHPPNGNNHSDKSIELQHKFDINGDPLSLRRSSNQSISEMSERLVAITENPPIWQLNQLRKLIGKCINDERVQGFILLLIIINAIMMGVATFPVVKNNPTISSKFEVIDQIFLVIFTIEASMQVVYHGWTIFKDAFLVFDLTIVALSWAAEGVKVIRAFRIFRALRLISRIDTMKNLILAVNSVIPRVTGIVMLLFLVFYVFAVLFTQLFKDVSKQYPRTEQYFVGLPETFFTLFQIMTLDGWKKIYLQAYDEYAWAWLPFVVFVVVSAFIFVNLMIAVICDAVHVMGDEEAAGMIGCDVAEIAEMRSADAFQLSPKGTDSSVPLRQKLRELKKDIEEIISIQNELVSAISIVARSRPVIEEPSFIEQKNSYP